MIRNFLEIFMGGGRARLEPVPRRESGVAGFVYSLEKKRVEEALHFVLATYTPSSEPLDQIGLDMEFRWMQELALSWLDVEALLMRVAQLNSRRLWQTLLDEKDEGIQERVNKHLKTPDIIHSAQSIEKNNVRFMTPVVVLAALGASVGENIKQYPKYAFFAQGQGDVAWHVGVEVGERFKTPAQNPKILVERLQRLFGGKEPYGLFPLLLKHQVFQKEIKNLWRYCPAPTLTSWVFEAYADILGNPSYQERFIRAVSKPTPDILPPG